MNKFFKILPVVTIFLLGCEHTEEKRWKTSQFKTSDEVKNILKNLNDHKKIDLTKPYVNIYTYAAPKKDSAPITILNLSDNGQAAFIQAITKKNAKSENINSILSDKSVSSYYSGLTNKKKYNRFDRTLVATVTKGLNAKPGDRLMWTSIHIEPKNFEFDGYTILATDNEVLNILDLESETNSSVQAEISAPTKPSAGITANYGNKYTTSANVTEQYVKNSVDIVPNFLRIYRESARNLDVAGNTLINFTAVIKDPSKTNAPKELRVLSGSNLILYKDSKILLPNDASIDITLDISPPYCPLIAKVCMIYQLRTIISNQESYIEGDQEIKIEKDSICKEDVNIMTANEIQPNTWQIKDKESETPVYATTFNNESLDLVFQDFETAYYFAEWMKKTRARYIGKGNRYVKLTLGGENIPEIYPNLEVKKTVKEEDKNICEKMNI